MASAVLVKTGRIVLCSLCILALWIPVQITVGVLVGSVVFLVPSLTVSGMLNPVVLGALALGSAAITIPLGINLGRRASAWLASLRWQRQGA